MFARLSLRFKLALIIALATSALLSGFTVLLTAHVKRVNIEHEAAALKEFNATILNMIGQADELLRVETERWGKLFQSKFSGAFTLAGSDAGGASGTPILKLDGKPLNGRFDEVDGFTRESDGNVATIFARRGDDFVRISTSLKKEDGTRATGTLLDRTHPAYAKLIAGEDYTGIATLFGRPYMTRYRPLRDAGGRVIAALFVGMDATATIDFVRQSVKQIHIGKTGYAYVLDGEDGPGAGTILIHPTQEGQNVIAAKDSNGREFIREMLKLRNGSIVYPWLNPAAGETSPREKIVSFAEFKDWHWIVASGSYTDEIFGLADEIRRALVTAALVLSLALFGVLTYYINKLVIDPVLTATEVATRFSYGDLSASTELSREDEIGFLLSALQRTGQQLRRIIGDVRAAADRLSDASRQVAKTAQSLSQLAVRQATATAASSASVEQMTASIARNADNAGRADSIAAKAARDALEGGESVWRAVDAIEAIGDKAGVIDELADRLKLLADDAATEALEAGGNGEACAALVEEVCRIAERSQTTAREIGRTARESVALAESTGTLLATMVPSVQKTSALLQQIATASREQSAQVDQIGGTISGLTHAIRQKTASAEELAATAEEMAAQAEQLQRLMRFFHLAGDAPATAAESPPPASAHG